MPSFTIEAPAEAHPLTREEVYRVLCSASSNVPIQIQTGTKQLQNWENLEGFYSTLQSIYIDLSAPIDIRHLAILQLKNGVDKRWKRGSQRPISTEEKELIRSRCIDGVLNEPNDRLAVQASIFTARVLRSDVQRDWADPVETIVSKLNTIWQQNPSSFHLARALLLLLYVVKELSTAKLGVHQKTLRSLAPTISEALCSVYVELVNKWSAYLQFQSDSEDIAVDTLKTSLLALRTLRRLLIVGYEHPNRNSLVCQQWPDLINQLGLMLPLVGFGSDSTHGLGAMPKRLVEAHLMQLAKLHLNMAKEHPAAFVLLPNSIQLAKEYWGLASLFGETYGKSLSKDLMVGTDGDADENEIPFKERFSLKALLLIRACSKMVFNPIKTFKYPSETDKEEKSQVNSIMRNELLTPIFAREVAETLMAKFFVFTPRDLRQWEEEPDEWEKNQEGMGEDWEFTIRICAEKLFLDMVINFKDYTGIVDKLMEIFANTQRFRTQDVWFNDSTYAAIGLAAPVLYDKFNFAHFLKDNLVSDVQVNRPEYNIIRRRIAIVLSQWVPVRDDLDRPLIYQIFQHLLDKSDPVNDEVVRVTAGRKFGDVVDPFDFKPNEFSPYASTVITRLIDLVQEVQLSETKLALLNTLHIIVVKMEQAVSPFSEQILASLPPLWDAAPNDMLIKEMILGVLSALISSMRGDSRRYHVALVPLIASSTALNKSSDELYLAEEALNLWSVMLDETVTPAPEPIVHLFSNLLALLELQSEMLDKALSILDAYIYLIPNDIISNASLVFSKFIPILSGRRREPIGQITHSLDLVFISAAKHGGMLAIEQVVSSLLSTNFLPTILLSLRDAYEAHQTSGPKQKIPNIDGVVETDYLSILARIALASPDLLISAYNAAMPFPLPIDWLFEEWFAHIDNIVATHRKKLATLALTSFLDTNAPWVLTKLQLFMSMWTSGLMELEDSYEDTAQAPGTYVTRDILVVNNERLQAMETASPSVQRSRELDMVDPVHVCETRGYIREKLAGLVQRNGGSDAFSANWVSNVEKEVVGAFAELAVI